MDTAASRARHIAVGIVALALMMCACVLPGNAYAESGGLAAADQPSLMTQDSTEFYKYNAERWDTAYPGVFTTAVDKNTAATAAEGEKIGIWAIDDKNNPALATTPTTESPAIICGSAVNWYQADGDKAAIEAAKKENARKFTAVSPNRVAPYSYFKYGVDVVKEADGKTPKKDADGNTIPKLSGFDGSYVIMRLDVSKLFVREDGTQIKVGDADAKDYYLHVQQAKNNALLVAIGQNGKTFSNLRAGANNSQVHNKVGSYNIGEMLDAGANDTHKDTPYYDVILFSSANIVAGADAQKEGALNGDVELSFYVDKQAEKAEPAEPYDPTKQFEKPEDATAYTESYFKKYYDEDAAKAAAKEAGRELEVSRYTVMGSTFALETMVEGANTAEATTFWSLRKALQEYQDDTSKACYYDTHGKQGDCGTWVKLICEVPVVQGLKLESADASNPRKRTLDVNSYDIQVANNKSSGQGDYTSGLTLKNAWLEIDDSNNTTGAELAIGNNAKMLIDAGGKFIVGEKCQLEIEWDGATVQPAAEGQPTPTPDNLNNGSLELMPGGVLENKGVITIEGTEGKPYQPGTGAETATESTKGQGEMTVLEGATFTNEGCFMPNGSLYIQGTFVNNGKYADTIVSNDPDKGKFTYHKGIQSTWKDDVTQKNIIYGGIYVGMDKNRNPKAVDKAVLENNGDIVLCPGELINMGTITNNSGAHIYSCATDKAIIPIEPDPNNPTVVTKEVTFDTPRGSYIINVKPSMEWDAMIVNNGDIVPAHVTVEKTGSLGALEVDNVEAKFKDCFVYFSYEGKISGTGKLYKHDLATSDVQLMMGPDVFESAPYDGMAWNPDIVVKKGNEYYFDRYDDFTATYQDPSGKTIEAEDAIDAGTYKIVLGEGNAFTGQAVKTFTIKPTALTDAELDQDTFTYDGDVHRPAPKSAYAMVGDWKVNVPTSGGYTLSYSSESPKEVGTYTVTIHGTGNFTGSVAKAFNIVAATPDTREKITDFALSQDSFEYDGKVHKPEVTSVKAGDKAVPEDGYKVTYSNPNPINEGAYIVTVEGTGEFTGSVSKAFSIVDKVTPAPVARVTTITDFEFGPATFAYDGTAHKPSVTSVKAGSKTVPPYGYTVSYSNGNATEVGEYSVTVTGNGGGFDGSITKKFMIVPAKLSDVVLSAESFAYDGDPHKPSVTSVKAGSVDVPASAYDVSYSNENPTEVGDYTVTITGKGGTFEGTVTKTFKIDPIALTAVELDADTFAYDGKEHKPAVKSVKAGSEDVPATAYEVSYSSESPTDAGDYTVSVTGKGNFGGTVTKEFKIEPATITAAELSAATFSYNGKAQKPTAKSVKAGDMDVPAIGYTLGYSVESPTNAGTYTATIAGTGNFTGSVEKAFTINKAANTLVVKGKTAKAKRAALKKKAKTIKRAKLMDVSKAQGSVAYTLAGVSKAKFKKYFKVNAKTGNLTVKKGLKKKGAYKLSVTVSAAGNANCAAISKTVTCKVKVK